MKHATETPQSWIRAPGAPFVAEPKAPEPHLDWSKHTREKESKLIFVMFWVVTPTPIRIQGLTPCL